MAGENKPLLHLDEVSVIFWRKDGPVRPLAEVSLCVNPGEFVAIVGPSGAGKSLLLQVAAGEKPPSAGSVYFEGVDLYNAPRRLRREIRTSRIGFLPELARLAVRATIFENTLRGVPWRMHVVAKERAERLLEEFGLADKALWRPWELSLGQQQLVGLIRALAPKPDLLIADCPTRLLDDQYAHKVAEILKDFHLRGGTLVIATNDRRLHERADRVVRLENGVLVCR